MNAYIDRPNRGQWAPIRPGRPSAIAHVLLGFAGLAAGIFAAVYTHERVPSYWAALFAFVMVSWAIGSALPDVLTLPYPAQRLLYLALLPPLCVGVAVIAFDQWGTDWAAALAGLTGGGIVHTILGWIFFARVMRTRKAGWNRPVEVYQQRWGPLGPYAFVPQWYREQHGGGRVVESDRAPERKPAGVN